MTVTPPRFKAGFSETAQWSSACNEVLLGLGDIPEESNLGFIYLSDNHADDFGSILTYLREKTGIEHWCGTVGIGVASIAGDKFGRIDSREVYDQSALVALIGAFPSDSFQVFEAGQIEMDEGVRLVVTGDGVEKWLTENKPYLGVVHADPRDYSLPLQLSSLAAGLETYLVGGLTSSRTEMLQVADHVAESAVSGVLFNANAPAITGLTQGCSPIGEQRMVTVSEGRRIVTIDNRPALDVLKEDIGELLSRDLSRIGGYIFVGFPIAGNETEDYLVRNILSIDTGDGSLEITEETQPGQPIFFCRRDSDTARKDLNRLLDDLRARLPSSPKAGLYFSCLGRGQALFGPNSEELNVIRQEFGDMPLVGFYANGEISHDRLYGYTGVLTLFY
ncbi:FIST C-terminal domain-containing protein [Kiloniella laminariae]|uniref:FIST C-terminal domain-containing protein n=1 Tax=Kiloniella laminariae TaxID=454162 RepID=A0ABT4LIY5_9PROT|nr:FIST C-terminal domain-containing protein [Kiloniella laminariae]MCZ4281042.1 FIST C-terminal domain-containing protein [Kiloniella laminariae]